jgi:cysteine-rich repeat protein
MNPSSSSPRRSRLVVLAIFVCLLLLAGVGCSSGDSADDGGSCSLTECVSACVTAGRSGGSCVDGACVCNEPGGDADADADADVGPDADADADADGDGDADDDGDGFETTPVCGNGVVEVGEGCDDANTIAGDGCGSTCLVEPGYTCAGTAPSTCMFTCGDGTITGAEACDDGGLSAGDGCSPTCEVETGWTCTGTPSVCGPLCGDGLIVSDEECDGDPSRPCTTTCTTAGTQSCVACAWETTCMPPAEACNARDDDCDTTTDEGFPCALRATEYCTTTCGSEGTRTCETGCSWGACTPPAETCNGVDDDCDW